jgi:hypothetical protein
MLARHLIGAIALTALWAGAAAAQAPAASAIGNAPAAAGMSAPSAGDAAKAAVGSSVPNAPAAGNSAAPTSEVGRFGNLVGSPSTGSDDSSPAPIPGSPPTAPR